MTTSAPGSAPTTVLTTAARITAGRTSTALITIAHGRHDHLLRQYDAVAASLLRPDHLVVVAMDDPAIAGLAFSGERPRIVPVPTGAHGLPLAAARNAGARAALDAGADVLVFLDVDCLPAPGLIGAYADAARSPQWRDRLLSGPVAYLPPAPPAGYDLATLGTLAQPHPARPAPPDGEIIAGDDPALFWSLSFAVTADTWRRIGGFAEVYEGYGAEDTDFARTAELCGIPLAWVGGARAFHQYHPTSTPPIQHLDDIVRNATIYRERWGDWPMEGWLAAFERDGLLTRTASTVERSTPNSTTPGKEPP